MPIFKLHKSQVISILFSIFIISCVKQAPQLPSNKGNVPDKNIALLLKINKSIAVKEDSVLEKFVEKSGQKYQKNKQGFWYKIDESSNGTYLKQKETFRYKVKLFSLDGKLLLQEVKSATIGKKEIVVGIEEGIKLMKKGETATLIIPWYLAYGMKGNGKKVQAYTSIMYQVTLLE